MSQHDVTKLLQSLNSKDADEQEQLAALLYDELRATARAVMSSERKSHTLQATALANEAWMRLCGPDATPMEFSTRRHFLRVASRAMRHILVDHARAKRTAKRGGDATRIPLDDITARIEETNIDLLALDEALERLSEKDERMAQVVELRYFGGLTLAETGAALDLSSDQVHYSWEVARGWLHRELSRE